MAQGWDVDVPGSKIDFYEAPPVGVGNVVVRRFGSSGYNATDLWAFSAWNPGFGYPGEVEFYSDRLIFACTVAQPQTLFMSKAADYSNHGRTTPSLDSDGIVATINARQVNPIRELVPMDDLIILTASAEIKLTTGADEVVAPGKIGFSFQSYFGSSRLAANVVGDTVLLLQARGFVLRDLGFQFTKDGYTGNDLSVYAAHLLEGFTVVDTAFQQVPYSCLWMVRSDGALISVTYLREQEVVGWALHTTEGKYKTVATIPKGNENAVYFGIERMIGGHPRRYLEKLVPRYIEDVRDAFFVDSGLTYDGRGHAGVQTLSGGTAWTEDETLTLTVSGIPSLWVGATDVGDIVRGYDADGLSVELLVTGFVSATVVQVSSVGTVPVSLRGAFASWDLGRSTLSGLDHLEGKTVAVLADGSVQKQKVVVGGSIELDLPSYIAHVGLPYRAVGETLDINSPGNETIRDRKKIIPKVGFMVRNTRGLKAGPDEARLEDVKTEWNESDEVIPLLTGLAEYDIPCDIDANARVVFVQDDPLPAEVLGIIPRVEVLG